MPPKNRERTNRMLALMQLHANGRDDVHASTHLIRAWLEGPPGPLAPPPSATNKKAPPSGAGKNAHHSAAHNKETGA